MSNGVAEDESTTGMANGLSVRPFTDEDSAAVAGVMNAVSTETGGGLELPPGAIESVVRSEVLDPEKDTRLVCDADGRVVAVALVRLPPVGGSRVTLSGAVLPTHRGMRLGRMLLSWQLARAAVRHDELAPDVAWTAELDAGADDASALRLYERMGFAPERYFFEMSAATTPDAGGPDVPGMQILPFAGREHEVYAAHQSAFDGSWGFQRRTFESWAALTVRADTFLSELALLAVADGDVVGYLLPYADAPDAFYIGQVGTVHEWRRRGVASALLAEVLRSAHRRGYTTAGLETDAASPEGAPRVYQKLGFVVDRSVVVYRRPLPGTNSSS